MGFRLTVLSVLLCFGINLIGPVTPVSAQAIAAIPLPAVMVTPTPVFTPALMRGLKIHPDNPFEFEFIIDTAQTGLSGADLEGESTRLIKYFLASLTVPEKDLWVNLSPNEEDRIIAPEFGTTEMGRDMLAQDYLLKQFAASLMYPEGETGRKFWERVYRRAHQEFGTTNIPINTFNKVWIVPEKAKVYESDDGAYVLETHLKVMLEDDYARSSDLLPAQKRAFTDQPNFTAALVK
ncbi:MAG: hypothetical protein K8I00_08150, partial [Candidatus Omnitrophica bacterium]|nr:hypothetical protein [Candidatus Omnitrophota bacterium]